MSDGFGSKLRAGDFVITAEISPPLSSDPEDLLEKAMPLGGLANAVNITDGASARVHLSALAAAAILVREGIEPVFDLDSRKLIETAVGIRDRHELPSGRRVAGDADFFIGVADTPLDPAPSWTPVSLRNKIAAGAQFAQTQFCMDGAITRRYMNRLTEEGITERLFVLIGIAPLPSVRTAVWMREHLPGSIIPDAVIDRLARAGDPKAEGKRICIELLQELTQIPDVSGAHIMAPRNHSAIAEVIAEARSAGISSVRTQSTGGAEACA